MAQNHFERRTLFDTKIAKTGHGIGIFGAVPEHAGESASTPGIGAACSSFGASGFTRKRWRCRYYD
jgi:hypothetical protein